MGRTAIALAAGFVVLVAGAPAARGARVTVQSFNSMAEFQASALYAYITGSGGGVTVRKTRGVSAVRQGSSDVPLASAGFAGNTAVTPDVLSAASDVPDVFSLNETPSFYDKRFVSLGTETQGLPPYITLGITPASSDPQGGFQGYDVVVFDLGKNLAVGSGNQNNEATIFHVELLSQGTLYEVGTISATGGNFINAILLDITGIPGISLVIDAVRISDVTGTEVAARGGIDVDGALTLNLAHSTAAQPSSWGGVKRRFR